jgi:hypothetical protein
MARTVEQIERDLADLERSTATLADEFQRSYQKYLETLGEAARKQLIFACHHICTQIYPEEFLQLSLVKRQQMQQSLLSLGKTVQAKLVQCLHSPSRLPRLSSNVSAYPSLGEDLPLIKTDPVDREAIDPLHFSAESESPPPLNAQGTLLSPGQLQRWQEWLEQALIETLRGVSWDANRLLQNAEILPPSLPEPLLEIAMKADGLGEGTAGRPNVLDITLEAFKEVTIPQNVPEETANLLPNTPLHLTAVRLNVLDIEFTDPTVATSRNQIRHLSAQLHKLAKTYHHKQQERAIAAAEEAWRASWFE